MKKSHVTTMLLLWILSLAVIVYGRGPAAPQSQAVSPAQDISQRKVEIRETTGKLTLLRVDESGVHHVKIKLQSEPQRAFSFALGGSSKEAMFDLLREAFVRDMTVEISLVKYPNSSTNTITQVSLKR